MHFSHYGRMCPIETPEGPNIGLIGALVDVRPGQRVRLHRDAVPQGRRTARSPTRSSTWPPTRRRTTSSPRPTRRSTPTARSRTTACSCAGRPQAASLEDLAGCSRPRASSVPPPTSRYVPPARGRPHGRQPEADRLGRHRADPVPRARRRQPRPDGRQHAAAGRAAGARRGAVHRHRHRGPCRPRRRRPDPGHRRRRGHRGHRRRDHRPVQRRPASKIYRLAKFRRSQPGHLHQPARRGSSRARRSSRARSSPTVRPPTTASWRSARTCSSP